MAGTDTGSLVLGAIPGLPEHMKTAGVNAPAAFYVIGNPNNVLTNVAGSDIAIDSTNGKYYIAKTPAGGSTWYSLGSTT